jgi:hypothetical protein
MRITLLLLFVLCFELCSIAQTTNPSFSNDEIKQILDGAKNKKIVGIAENVHWIKEYKNDQYQISKLLIDSLGYNAIFIEVSDIQVNNTMRLQDFKDYDKTYKLAKEMKLPIIGINTAFGEDIRILIEATKATDSLFSKQLDKIFVLNKSNEAYYWYKMPFNELEGLKTKVMVLTPNEYTLNNFPNVINDLIENINYIYLKRSRTDRIRDSFMFAKIDNYLIKKPNHKVIVIAHTMHLAKSSKIKRENLGSLLQKKYENDLFAISTEYEKGIVYTYTEEKQKSDTNYFKPITNKKTIWNDKNILVKRVMDTRNLSNSKYSTRFIGGSYAKHFSLRKINYQDVADLIITYHNINYQGLK